MKRINGLALRGVSLGLVLLLASSPSAPAQTFYSVTGGRNVARHVPVGPSGLYQAYMSLGFTAQASVGRQVTRQVGWRLDAFISQFDLTQPSDFAGVMCAYYPPPPGACCGICPRGTSRDVVGVTGLAASQFVNLLPSSFGVGVYVIGGIETDYVYRDPVAQGAVRPGFSAGLGITVPVGDHRRAVLEARYHRLLEAPSQLTWIAPVSVGVQF